MGQAEVATEAAIEAVIAADRMVELTGELEVGREGLVQSAAELRTTTSEIAEHLEAGHIDLARQMVEETTLPQVSLLANAVSMEAGTLASRIAGERSEAGQLARTASYVVALIVPAMTVAGFRRAAKRKIEKERLEAELLRERELGEAKDHLIAGLSHQLRTPITGIYGFADLLLTHRDPELVEEGLGVILKEAGNLRRMVDDILVTARIDAESVGISLAPTEVTDVVDRTLAHFQRLGASIKLDCEAAAIQVDGARLEHVLRNLVANALHHGGEPVQVLGRRARDTYRLAICDSGPGLDPSSIPDPFRPFIHAPESVTVKGSIGLGLSVARTLIEAMAGTIEHTRVDGTTVFAITLPIELSRSGPTDPAPTASLAQPKPD
jgi:two-component system sensor histidine kinase MtrB